MTIVIPTWIVVVLICLMTFRSYIGLKRTAKMMKGLKELYPSLKEFLSSKNEVSINISKTVTEKDEDSGTR